MSNAADMRVLGVSLVGQQTGLSPDPNGFSPNPVPTLRDQTGLRGLFAADIGMLWDSGEPTPRCMVMYGDWFNEAWLGGGNYSVQTRRTNNLHSIQPSRLATSFAGGGPDNLYIAATGSLNKWPNSGYVSVATGSADLDGWATFRYSGKSKPTSDTVQLSNVKWICGDSYVNPGSTVAIGSVRIGNGFLHGTIGWSTDHDLSNGYTHAAFYGDPAHPGVPDEYFRHNGITQTVLGLEAVFPALAGAPNPFLKVSNVVKRGFFLEFTTTTAHGIPTDVTPGAGGPIYLIGHFSKQATNGSGSWSTSAVPSTIACTQSFDAAPDSFAIELTSGAYARIAYTERSGTEFTGCALQSGSPTGTVKANGNVRQGVENINDFEWIVYDAPTSTKFRVLVYNSPFGDRTGNLTSDGANCYVFLPGVNSAHLASPETAPMLGPTPWGAVSVPHVGALNGRRQVMFSNNSYLLHTRSDGIAFSFFISEEVRYSDDGGDHWTLGDMRANNARLNDPAILSFTPWIDENNVLGESGTDLYAYSIVAPGMYLARVKVADILDLSAREYYNHATSSWSTSMPSATNGRVWSGAASGNACQIGYNDHFGVFYCTYNGTFEVLIRFADDIRGTWTAPQKLVNSASFIGQNGVALHYVYGGWVHPWSAETDPEALFFNFTLYAPYQVYLGKAPLVDITAVEGVPGDVVDHYEQQVQKPGSRIVDPVLDGPYLRDWDSWIYDSHEWVRLGDHQFSIAADVRDHLRPGTKVSYSDNGGSTTEFGVVGSVSFGSGITTVNLIPNTDYAMAAATISSRRYSHAASPPGYPEWFNYSPTITGYSANPTNTCYRFKVDGRTLTVLLREATAGTSNATTKTYSLPSGCTATSTSNYFTDAAASIIDNGGSIAQGRAFVSVGTSTIDVRTSWALAAWTNSGSARVISTLIPVELA